MRRIGLFLLLALMAGAYWVLVERTASGQSPAVVEGVIQDASGAVIPAATVELFTNQMVLAGSSITDSSGRYRFTGVVPGRYVLRAAARGFQRTMAEITVEPGKTLRRSLVLQVGTVQEGVQTAPREVAQPNVGVVGGVAGGVPGGTMGGVIGGIIGGVPTAAPPPPPPPYSVHHRMGRIRAPESHENYGRYVENGFQSPAANPLSTFSIDVDTASYANMRRFLRNGNRPPIDSIRTEEWLNYFQYRYPEPEGEHPVSITTELAASPWQPKHKLVRIGLKSKAVETRNLPPANLVFLVDVSGSMSSPDKLPLLKRSFALLAEQLRPQDDVAVVVYAGAAGTVLPSTSGREKGRILEALERLHAGGSTAGAQGLQLAYQTARAHFKPKGNNRVILATDGDFNVGVASEAELVRLIEKERGGGIYLTVLGFGTGNFQDAKMKALSKHGNGNYAYVDSLLEARKVLVQEMGANLLTVAKDVKLQIEFNPARVQAYRLIGYESRLLAAEDFNNDKKDAGEMGAGHTVTALYEIVPHGVSGTIAKVDDLKYQKPQQTPAGKSQELLTVKLRYKPPTSDVSKLMAQAVEDRETKQSPSEDFRFAAAVAGFSMLLRDSDHKAGASFEQVIQLASQSLGTDPQGHRAEFLYLVKTAQGMTASQ